MNRPSRNSPVRPSNLTAMLSATVISALLVGIVGCASDTAETNVPGVTKTDGNKPGGDPAVASTGKSKPKPKPKPKPKTETEIDPNARPGLGFMPVYEEGDEPGCGVQMVVEGSAAEKAGIKKGDLIVKLDGEVIDDVRSYSDVLGGLEIGSKVKVVVKRGEKTLELEAVVGESRR